MPRVGLGSGKLFRQPLYARLVYSLERCIVLPQLTASDVNAWDGIWAGGCASTGVIVGGQQHSMLLLSELIHLVC